MLDDGFGGHTFRQEQAHQVIGDRRRYGGLNNLFLLSATQQPVVALDREQGAER